MSPSRGLRRAFYAVIALAALVVVVATFAAARAANIDDAFILLVYVRHFAETGSIYWNAQEARVDGCTSILDMVLKAALYKALGGDLLRLDWLVTFVTMLLGAGLGTWLCAALERRYGPGRVFTAGLGALALASNRASAEGAKMLLESPLFLSTLLAALAFALVPRRLTRGVLAAMGVSWVLVALARPEGLVLVAALGGFLLWTERSRLPRGDLALPLVIAAAALGLYYAWHTRYFGYWAPNTYYAKTSDSRWREIRDGVDYVTGYLSVGPWSVVAVLSVVLAPVLAAVPRWRSTPAHRAFVLLSGLAVLDLACVVFAGGDAYPRVGRFLACSTTLSSLALVLAGVGLRGPARFVGPSVLALMVATSAYASSERENGDESVASWPKSDPTCQRDSARGLRGLGVGRVAETDLQAIKFYDDAMTVIDASALSDKVAAHLPAPGQVLAGKGGVAYAMDRDAEIIVVGSWPVSREAMGKHAPEEILGDAQLSDRLMGHLNGADLTGVVARYRGASIPACGRYLNLWIRRDVAERLGGRPDVLLSPEPTR